MALHDPEEDRRKGLMGLLTSGAQAIDRGMRAVTPANLAKIPGLLDRAMQFVGDNPFSFLPGTGEAIALGESAQAFGEGRPGMGLMALAGAVPGVPGGLFKGVEGLREAGLRVFARAEGPGMRSVASITPNPKGKGVKVSVFDETAEQGASGVPTSVAEFDSVDEAVEAISGKNRRGFFQGFEEIPVGPEDVMEGRFERVAERGLFPQSATDPIQARGRAEARRAGSVGGFFAP